MSKITAVIDGTTHEVDLTKVTGMDAMQFRMETGQELDLAVLGIIEQGGAVLLADLAVVKWLWLRQNGEPLANFALTAATVTLFPADHESRMTDQEHVAASLRAVAEAQAEVAAAQTALIEATDAVRSEAASAGEGLTVP
jgi:hypothetical protein